MIGVNEVIKVTMTQTFLRFSFTFEAPNLTQWCDNAKQTSGLSWNEIDGDEQNLHSEIAMLRAGKRFYLDRGRLSKIEDAVGRFYPNPVRSCEALAFAHCSLASSNQSNIKYLFRSLSRITNAKLDQDLELRCIEVISLFYATSFDDYNTEIADRFGHNTLKLVLILQEYHEYCTHSNGEDFEFEDSKTGELINMLYSFIGINFNPHQELI